MNDKIKFLNDLGYEVVSDDLSKNLIVRCKNGHEFKRRFYDFQRGTIMCIQCDHNSKLFYLNSLGYSVKSKLINNNLEVRCKNGHSFKRAWSEFKNGNIKCAMCYEQHKIDFLNKLGYTILDINKIKVKCKHGHVFDRIWSHFNSGVVECKQCKNNIKIEYMKFAELEPISENIADGLELKCKNGHVFKRTFSNLKKCNVCPICHSNISSFEKEVKEILPKCIENDYSVLGDKELDFYLPEYNLAIECNGDYWHSEQMGKSNSYHLNKTEKCKEKGIQLLQIFESSWIEKKEIWTSIINNKLGKSKKIMARKCVLREVSKAEEKEFLDTNHLQGFTGSSICYGLYYQNELICLMSFGKPRFTGKYDWELIRLCTKMGVNVVGGASKLLSYFHKHNPGSLISYSDRLYSDGSIYKQLGFEFNHYSAPGYFYCKNKIKYSRQQFMKHKLKDKLEKFDPNLTESENMRLNGYHKVWDCGQGVWVKGSI
ncbi:hypothetical protein [Campylobacter phage vB_Cj_QDYZ]|uniref:Hef-like homing endonuclease n=1 Tax=Campylobacter phage vB_Cj_QDYZ TaxID=3032374 RepID=A0AAF0GFM6_9CAUD|nr:hypothetical protein [Campylobacter phage vB_Cj_QDYZ]